MILESIIQVLEKLLGVFIDHLVDLGLHKADPRNRKGQEEELAVL